MTGDGWDRGFECGERRADTPRDGYVRAWLEGLLANGETNVSVIVAEGRHAGITLRTLSRAADTLGVIRLGEGLEATWQLPAGEAP